MGDRERFWRSPRWLDALRPDAGLAQAEGLAAGTGLLTGSVARHVADQTAVSSPPCPACSADGDIVVVDLVAQVTTRRCHGCGLRWTAEN